MTRQLTLTFALLVPVVALAETPAQPPPGAAEPPASTAPAKCKVSVVRATEGTGGVDPRAEALKPYVSQPPFNAWKSFQVVGEREMTLTPSTTGEFDLPNGKKTTLTFIEHLVTKKQKHRMRLRLTIGKGPKQSLDTTFVLDEGGMMVQAGQKHDKSLILIAVSCKTQD